MTSEARKHEIEALIASEDSPVGIDAKKTHVLILLMLERIERRLEALESKMERLEGLDPD